MQKTVQRPISLSPKHRGVHLVTDEILRQIPETTDFSMGLLHLFLQHTSAGLAINENADPDVRRDTAYFLDRLIPDGYAGFHHVLEGPDDMPAHLKSMLLGCQLTIPIINGEPALGLWQGIYLIEGRDHGGSRRIVVTLQGEVRG